jgi:hypothetical protein
MVVVGSLLLVVLGAASQAAGTLNVSAVSSRTYLIPTARASAAPTSYGATTARASVAAVAKLRIGLLRASVARIMYSIAAT